MRRFPEENPTKKIIPLSTNSFTIRCPDGIVDSEEGFELSRSYPGQTDQYDRVGLGSSSGSDKPSFSIANLIFACSRQHCFAEQ